MKTFISKKKTTIVLSKHQSWNHEIKLKSEKQLTFELIYALFEKKLKTFRKYLNENMKKEFIRKFESSTKYSILFVFKKNDTFRLCVDYRKLNNITIKNRYSLFNISELQNRLQKIMYFIKFDLRETYNLIRMKADEKWKTTFRTRYEHYEYMMMSFEFINVSTTCQEMINDALRQYFDIFVIVYLNDILIFFKIMKLHVNHVITVFKCLNKKNLRLKSKKCEFHKEKIDFLNFVIERNEIRIDSKKIRAIQNWKSLINVKKFQSFLKFINYNRKFIKNYFSKAISLINLTTKNKLWSWKKKKRNAFNKLQQACITNSVLKMFDTKKSIRLKIDASDLVIEACINQKHDDKWYSVIYFSRKLSSAEQNYDIHDKELLAIVIFLKQWRIYAEETSEFIIFTNHKNFLHFITTKQFNKRQVRWSKLLKQYKFTIFYTSKKENDRTNALNRRSDYMKTKKIFNHNILKINKNESLSVNKHELNAILKILKNDQKQYSIEKKRLHISNDKIDEIIKNHHDESLQSHSNVFKTLQLLRQICQFLNMKQHVEIYIRKCFNCQKNKHAIHAKYDEIQYQKSSKSSWNEISMNFIIKLSKSKNSATIIKYDSILMIVNKLIKYSHIIFFKKKFIAEQLETIILNRFIKYHEISKNIISDRNKFFTFNYWKTLIFY